MIVMIIIITQVEAVVSGDDYDDIDVQNGGDEIDDVCDGGESSGGDGSRVVK